MYLVLVGCGSGSYKHYLGDVGKYAQVYMNRISMATQEYQALSDKIDRLTEKIDNQFIRFEDVKLSKSEYQHAHEGLIYRVNAIESKIDAELKASDAIHEKLDIASETRY